MKIASWNVNSISVRLPQVLDYLQNADLDILALQETKTIDEKFPQAEIQALGYHVSFAGQKTYNGVATISREPVQDVVSALPNFEDEQKRFLAATIAGVRVINVYVPNGSDVGTEKYAYKLNWLKALAIFLGQELERYPRLLIMGDYNIAPADADVYDPKKWQGKILCSDAERQALDALLTLGLHDSFRLFKQEQEVFSWFDYRTRAFLGNRGLRIDLILLSNALKSECRAAGIDLSPRHHQRPSDHAPVWLEL